MSQMNSCIEHPRLQRCLVIRPYYLDLFERDFATAALLATMEHLCNCEFTRMGKLSQEQKNEPPWMCLSMPDIQYAMLGVYSARSTHRAMQTLESLGLIESEQLGLGKPNRYKFHFSRVQEAINNRYTSTDGFATASWKQNAPDLPKLQGLKTAPRVTRETPLDCQTADKMASHNLIDSLAKEEEEEEEPPIVPLSLPEPEPTAQPQPLLPSPEDSELTFDKISDWMDTQVRSLDLVPPRTHPGPHLQEILFAEYSESPQKFRCRLRDFFQAGGRSYDVFARSGKTSRFGAGRKSGEMPRATPRYPSSRTPASEPSAFPGESVRLTEWMETWDKLVPSRPADHDVAGYWMAGVREAMTSEAFTANFDQICQKSEKIVKAKGPEASWLTLRWLFSSKDGGPANWRKIQSGELDFMVAKGKGGDAAAGMAAIEALRAKLRQEKAMKEKK